MVFFISLITSALSLAILRNRITILFWVALSLISAFRFEVGTDYPNYVDLYNDIKNGFDSYLHMEPFHFILNEIAGALKLGPQFVFLIYALLTNAIFAVFFFRISQLPTNANAKVIFALCTLLYLGNYYFLSLNSIRSCLAASLYALSLEYYLRQKKLNMFLSLFVGGLIHFSLIPIAIVTIISLKFIFPVRTKVFFILSAILLINPIGILSYIFVSYKLMYYNYFISERYAVPATLIGQISAYGSVFLILVFYYIISRNMKINNNRLRATFQLCVLSLVAFKIFSVQFFVLARISRYFSPFIYFFIAYAIAFYLSQNSVKKIKNQVFIMVVLFITLTNIVMFLPRGLSDISYSNYQINYCVISEDVCNIPLLDK